MATKTANSYTKDRGSLEVQITSALQGVNANLDVADVGEWVDASGFLKTQNRTNRERQHSEEYTTAESDPISVVSENITPQVHTFTILDTDGAEEDLGLTNNINVVEDILEPSFENKLALPFRYTNKGNSTGNKLFTHAAANNPQILSLSEPEIEAGSNALATRTLMMKTTGKAAESTAA